MSKDEQQRKSGRKAPKTIKYDATYTAANPGNSHDPDVRPTSSTNAKNKGKNKRTKRVIYSSSSEHNTSSETVSSEDSRESERESTHIAKRTRIASVSGKCYL